MYNLNKTRKRAPIIGVMGSGRKSPHEHLAYQLGCLIAREGYILLTGGGGGIMEAASRGAAETNGIVVGILPSNGPEDPRYGIYPNPYVTIPIYTGMSDARNVINVKSSDVVAVLPGGGGTLSEIGLALKSKKPVIVIRWPELVLPPECPKELIYHADDALSALRLIKALLD